MNTYKRCWGTETLASIKKCGIVIIVLESETCLLRDPKNISESQRQTILEYVRGKCGGLQVFMLGEVRTAHL